MKNWIAVPLLCGLFALSGVAAAQQSPALTRRKPIPLTKVEGRMDRH